MSLVKFFTALVNIFCGSSDSKPGGGQTQPHGQQQQHQQHHQQQQQHQQQHSTPQQPHYPPQKPQQSPSPPHRPAQGGHHYSDPNQENQHNEHYTRLRAQANEEGDKMAQCFASSHEAYERGDGAGAKQLSNEGKEHQRKMISTNKEASNWIFIENNKDSKPGEIDLHGLYVKEAIEHTDRALQEAKQRGDSELHLIVGKGLHSQGGAAKIKPAIEELMQKHQLFAELDPDNAGVLVVQMGRQGGVGPDEIARRLERDDQGCTIM
ncbi:cytoplasmic protein [Mycena crocata]|nr:cytoplasmic protein [Mycena crocata]